MKKRFAVIAALFCVLAACDEESNIHIQGGSGCGLRADGTAVCWGSGSPYSLTPPAGVQFRAVGAAQEFACGLTNAGAIRCWGRMSSTQAGPFTGLAVGRVDVCGLTDSAIHCWSPDRVGTTISGTFGSISMGDEDLVCGIDSESEEVECYDISVRQSGWSGPWLQSPYGVRYAMASVGAAACGIRTNGTVSCWSGITATPPTGANFREIAVGQNFACAVRETGQVACWGDDSDGQLQVPAGWYRELSAYREGMCGIRTDGTVRCWGTGVSGNTAVPAGLVLKVASSS